MNVRVTPELRAWLTAKAQAENRSLSRQIVHLLQAAMAADITTGKETN